MEYDNAQFFTGMEVFDSDGRKIGSLIQYDLRLGYLEAQGGFSGPRYIPFHAIESFTADAINLNVSKDVVSSIYKRKPAVVPEVSPSGRLTGQATVESGRAGGGRVPLDAEQLLELRDRLEEGMTVYDESEQEIGSVDAYDRTTGYMKVEEGMLAPKPVFIPATTVAFLDERGVHLSITKDAIADRYTRVPQVVNASLAR
jgi:hypothetical protein